MSCGRSSWSEAVHTVLGGHGLRQYTLCPMVDGDGLRQYIVLAGDGLRRYTQCPVVGGHGLRQYTQLVHDGSSWVGSLSVQAARWESWCSWSQDKDLQEPSSVSSTLVWLLLPFR